ncbi:hypothetical protein GXM_04888 [Nostoc sphaeroides CCNUC1]|uniref:Uncharacterized protein n=1 Tax=Nostoc sphaeroides CCNUC1 TaxID=2653204 RepID=A0A5P8W537_9NOSO|nr:hypothetical protein GXM_04888 [Nostoc sphaeroides CCNUC1]
MVIPLITLIPPFFIPYASRPIPNAPFPKQYFGQQIALLT